MPPMMKKTKAVTQYMIPIFLWSTVVNQLFQPVVARGRANRPRRAWTAAVAIVLYFSLVFHSYSSD